MENSFGYNQYVVPPLEGFWWQDNVDGVDYSNKDTFNWISVIRLPDFNCFFKLRNALVRANYNNWQNGIHATTEFLELFFENLLMNAGHELKNRFIHIDYDVQSATQGAKDNFSKCQNDTLELSLEELAIIQVLKNNPTATQKQIAEATGKSERTIKRRTVEMKEKGLISRENGKRNGKWIVLKDDYCITGKP